MRCCARWKAPSGLTSATTGGRPGCSSACRSWTACSCGAADELGAHRPAARAGRCAARPDRQRQERGRVAAGRAAVAGDRRGRLPLLVGGTMLYAKALREGLAELPPADPEVRDRLARQAAESGWPALHARLREVDPRTAQRLSPADGQRIQRALEVYELTGEPLSDLLQGAAADPMPLATIGWMPSDRAELHRRIEARFDSMLAAGLLEEVRALRARGDLDPGLPSIRSVGYRQAWDHLEGATSFDEFRAAAIAASRQLAKRQITWLRSMRDALVIDPLRGCRGCGSRPPASTSRPAQRTPRPRPTRRWRRPSRHSRSRS